MPPVRARCLRTTGFGARVISFDQRSAQNVELHRILTRVTFQCNSTMTWVVIAR